jgi:hypothetical protein
MTPQTLTAPRTSKRGKTNPIAAGLPDPRPVTGYGAEYQEIDGHSRITVTLDQPCIIRAPAWRFIDAFSGESVPADSMSVLDNVTIQFDFEAFLPESVNFIEVPYQDPQVQNFQGGFVRPGAQWFRAM